MTNDNAYDLIFQYFSKNKEKTFFGIKKDLKEIFNLSIDKQSLLKRIKAYQVSEGISITKPTPINIINPIKKYRMFSFGSNMNLKQMKERCPSSEFVQMVKLPNYKLVFNRFSKMRNGGVASIIKATNHYVWGAIFTMSADDVIALDRREGVGAGYSRRYIKEMDMWYYYVVKNEDNFVQPTKEYLDLIITGLNENFCPDKQYIEKIQKLYA